MAKSIKKYVNPLKAEVDGDPVLAAIVSTIETAACTETDWSRSVRLAKALRRKLAQLGLKN